MSGTQVSGRISRQQARGTPHLSLPAVYALSKVQSRVSGGIQLTRGIAYPGPQALLGLPRVRLVRTQPCLYSTQASARIRPRCQDPRPDNSAEVIQAYRLAKVLVGISGRLLPGRAGGVG